MTATAQDEKLDLTYVETWETTTAGLVYVEVTNASGNKVVTKVGGKKGAKLRIKTGDRIEIQESRYGNNPFVNGRLVRTDKPRTSKPGEPIPEIHEHQPDDGGGQAITDQQLIDAVQGPQGVVKYGRAWRAFIDSLSEFNLRRLDAMRHERNDDGSLAYDFRSSQIEYLEQALQQYRAGGDTPTNEELRRTARPDRLS